MKKALSLRSKIKFNKLIENGRRIKTPYFNFYFSNFSNAQIGISVPKKLGNAVFRNKHKRQIKNILDHFDFTNFPFELVIIIKVEFCILSFEKKKEFLINSLLKLQHENEKQSKKI